MVPPKVKDTMQTLQTGICNERSNSTNFILSNVQKALCNFSRGGFTLLELIVVLFIISLSLSLVMPSFWRSETDIIKSEARHISRTLRYIYDEAIGRKQTYLFSVNLDNETWGYKSQREQRTFTPQEDLEIQDIVVPSLGGISTGEVSVEFGPMGPEEPIILHLQKRKSVYTIMLNHLNGRIKILEGYKL